ncbi:aldolase/citrate lyase family protein [Paraburkholderia steynii]|nr:aldolase/citrate lyase family protein [Paraburkholderia steynii]
MLDYAKVANDQTGVIALIEHPDAIRALDAILSVDGLSGAIAAPFDLSVNMGFNDGPGHKEVQQAIQTISQKIKSRGFELTSFAVTPAQAVEAMRLGATNLFLGFDPMYIHASLQLFMTNVAAIANTDSRSD